MLALTCLGLGLGALTPCKALAAPDDTNDRAHVVLVTDNPNSEVAMLLAAELSSLGFSVDQQKPDAADRTPGKLRQLARQQNAVAAFQVSIHSESVEVWIADRVTGKVTLREVIQPEQGEPLAARTIVLRAVELLRWSLQELKAAYPARGEIEAPPEPVTELANTPTRGRQLALAAAGFVAKASGGADLSAGIALSTSLSWAAWGARLEVGQPIGKEHLASPQGQVEVSTQWAGAEATFSLLDHGIFNPSLGVGARVVALQLRGIVAPPLVGTSSRDYLVAPSLRARLTLELSPEFHVFADGTLSWLLGNTRVALAGERLGNVGPWLPTLTTGVELAMSD